MMIKRGLVVACFLLANHPCIAQSFRTRDCGPFSDPGIWFPDNTSPGCPNTNANQSLGNITLPSMNWLNSALNADVADLRQRVDALKTDQGATSQKLSAELSAALKDALGDISKIPAMIAASPSVREYLLQSLKEDLLRDPDFLKRLNSEIANARSMPQAP